MRTRELLKKLQNAKMRIVQATNSNVESLSSELPPLPAEILLLIALEMSVLDVPNLVIVCKFLASKADILWQNHAARTFDIHPPQLFPGSITHFNWSWSQLLFRSHLKSPLVCYRRCAVYIKEGKIDDLRVQQEHGAPPMLINYKFIFQTPGGHPSLFQLAQASTETNKISLLNLFCEKVIAPHIRMLMGNPIYKEEALESIFTLARNALNISTLTLDAFDAFIQHIGKSIHIYSYSTPLTIAMNKYDPKMILFLLKCGADMNESNKNDGIVADTFIATIDRLGSSLAYRNTEDSEADTALFEYIKIHDAELHAKILPKINTANRMMTLSGVRKH